MRLAHLRNCVSIVIFIWLAYGCLAGGFLTDQWLGVDDPGFNFSNRSLVKYRLIIEEFGGWQHFQTLLSELRPIADNHQVTIASVALNCVVHDPAISAAIVGARYASNLEKQLSSLGFTLSPSEASSIQSVQAEAPGPQGPVFGLERDLSGPHGRIMKYNLNEGDNRQMSQSDIVRPS